MRACFAVISVTGAADSLFQCLEGMFHPGLANLFNAFLVISSTAHPIKVLGNDWMIGVGQCKPVDWLVAIVTRVCSDRQTHLSVNGPRIELAHVFDIPNNDIRSGH